jgi:hypothetical protein
MLHRRCRSHLDLSRARTDRGGELSVPPQSSSLGRECSSPESSALGAWKEISTHRSELAATLQDFNGAQFDKLGAYALATGHAHALFMAASAPAGLTELSEEVAKARELLLSDAVALAKRGVMDAQRLKELKGPPGY